MTANSFWESDLQKEFIVADFECPYLEKHITLISSFLENFSRKQLVFILCRNNIPTVIAYLKCLQFKHVPLLLDANLHPELLTKLDETYRPNVVFDIDSENELNSRFEKLRDDPVLLNPDLALLLSTSGTTGSPKLVKLSYENINSNALAIAEYLELTPKERPLLHLPLHYSFGLSILNSHLLTGSTILLTQHTVMQREFWTRMAEDGVTSLAGVPYTFEMLDRLRFDRKRLPTLKTLTQAGGKLSTTLVEKFGKICKEREMRFFVMYGQTEAAPRISYLPPNMVLSKQDSIGKPIPGGEWWVEDEIGVRLEPGKPGELVYQGANVMMGYAESQADLALPDQMGGILRTGDLAVFDNDGMARIIGRKKRMLKVFGHRIGLDELEQLLARQNIRAYCLGQEDRLEIALDPETKEAIDARDVASLLGLNHSAIQVFRPVRIPLNSSGKVDYLALAQQLRS